MSKVLVDRELLERWADKLEGADSAGYGWEALLATEVRGAIAQPAEAEGVEVIAYATPNEDGDWQMLFFDEKEAIQYVDDEPPAPLVLQSAHLAALSAVTAERDRLDMECGRLLEGKVQDAETIFLLEAERDKLRAEVEGLLKPLEQLADSGKWRYYTCTISQDAQGGPRSHPMHQIEVKTRELQGAALDWAVAKVEGFIDDPESWLYGAGLERIMAGTFRPSTHWSQGGPLIEQLGIEVFCNLSAEQASRFKDASPDWRACMNQGRSEHSYGPTPLIAAMRCLVATMRGDTVQVPAELLTKNPYLQESP